MTERIVIGADGRKYITTEPTPVQAQSEPYGYVVTDFRGMQYFYKDSPYLDNAKECVAVFAAPVQQDQRPKLNLDRQQEPANPFAVFQIIQERNEARDMIRKVEELNAELEEQNQQLLEALKRLIGGKMTMQEVLEAIQQARAAIALVEGKA